MVSAYTKHSDVVSLADVDRRVSIKLTRSLSRASRCIQMTGVKQMRCFRDVLKVNLLIRQMLSF